MLLLATLLLTCALQTHAQTSASVAVNSNLTGVGFFYPPFPDLVGLDTKIHVNYLDAIDVLWSGNTSIGPHAEDPSSYLGVQCWKTNATTEGICKSSRSTIWVFADASDLLFRVHDLSRSRCQSYGRFFTFYTHLSLAWIVLIEGQHDRLSKIQHLSIFPPAYLGLISQYHWKFDA